MAGQPATAKCFGSFPSVLWYSLFGQQKTRALTAALSLCAGFLHSPRLLPACRDGPEALINTQHPSHATSAAGSDSAEEAAASEGCRRGQHGAGGTCRWLRVEGARIPTQGRAAERAGAWAVPPGTRGRRLHRPVTSGRTGSGRIGRIFCLQSPSWSNGSDSPGPAATGGVRSCARYFSTRRGPGSAPTCPPPGLGLGAPAAPAGFVCPSLCTPLVRGDLDWKPERSLLWVSAGATAAPCDPPFPFQEPPAEAEAAPRTRLQEASLIWPWDKCSQFHSAELFANNVSNVLDKKGLCF